MAARELGDANFAESVVLLIAAGDSGALGLIINRPTAVPASQFLKSAPSGATLFEGGPVEVFRLAALRRGPGVDQVIRGVSYLTQTRDIERALKDDPAAVRLFAGYAGWGPGQLDREHATGVWKLLPATASVVFSPEPESLWNRLIRQTETIIARAP